MAEYLTLYDVQKHFWHILTELLDDSDIEIRLSWPKMGAPDWKITDSIIFVQVLEEGGDDISRPIFTEYEDSGDDYLVTRYGTRVIRLNLVAYGPKGYDALAKVRLYIGQHKTLRKSKIRLILEPDTIKNVPELFNGRWWQRADMDLKFNTIVAFSVTEKTYRYFTVSTERLKGTETETETQDIYADNAAGRK